ncbi:MAG: hypothetical protein ABID84_02365 [Chloroflexota bacterium]
MLIERRDFAGGQPEDQGAAAAHRLTLIHADVSGVLRAQTG